MDKGEAGDLADRRIQAWRAGLETLRSAAAERGDADLTARTERLRRGFQGLRIKKVAVWCGNGQNWEREAAGFEDDLSRWEEEAEALRAALSVPAPEQSPVLISSPRCAPEAERLST